MRRGWAGGERDGRGGGEDERGGDDRRISSANVIVEGESEPAEVVGDGFELVRLCGDREGEGEREREAEDANEEPSAGGRLCSASRISVVQICSHR